MCKCTAARQRFPRITREQVQDLDDRIHAVAATVHKTHLYRSHFLPRLLGQLKARSLASLNRAQYRAACLLLADDLAAAQKLVRHLKPALLAWSDLQIPQVLHVNYVSPIPGKSSDPWVIDGQPYAPPQLAR